MYQSPTKYESYFGLFFQISRIIAGQPAFNARFPIRFGGSSLPWSSTIDASTPGSGLPIDPPLISTDGKFTIICAPVSVIHLVSWIRRLNTSIPHFTTSGFNGSPTDNTCLSADKSYFSTALSLLPISILNAVGALYQTVTFNFSSAPYHDSGENLPPTITFVARFSHGAKIP